GVAAGSSEMPTLEGEPCVDVCQECVPHCLHRAFDVLPDPWVGVGDEPPPSTRRRGRPPAPRAMRRDGVLGPKPANSLRDQRGPRAGDGLAGEDAATPTSTNRGQRAAADLTTRVWTPGGTPTMPTDVRDAASRSAAPSVSTRVPPRTAPRTAARRGPTSSVPRRADAPRPRVPAVGRDREGARRPRGRTLQDRPPGE